MRRIEYLHSAVARVGKAIHMNAQEHRLRLCLCNCKALFQVSAATLTLDIHIIQRAVVLPCIFHPLAAQLQKQPELLHDRKIQIFFQNLARRAAAVVPAVARVQHIGNLFCFC